VLRIEELTKTYRASGRQVRALDGVSIQVAPGELVAVEGPSGCGKTTLLLVAGALLRPDGGQVTLAGQDPYALAPEARARFRAEHIGFVFQQFHLVPYLSALDNILAPALARDLPEARGRADELVERLGLSARRGHVPAELSTGERQRAALARAILGRPPVLLADEPTGNLDEENGRAVLGHLADYAAGGAAVLLVTHDPRAAGYAARVLLMEAGRIRDGR